MGVTGNQGGFKVRSLILYPDVWFLTGTGAPTNSVTGAGFAGKGSFYIRTSNGASYTNTGTKAAPTWSVQGTTTLDNVTLDANGAGSSVEVAPNSIGPTQFLTTLGDGFGHLWVARATFDPSTTAGLRTAAPHTLGVTIPDKYIVVGGVVQVNTLFTSTNSTSTIAISIQSANDIVTAAAVSGAPWSTAGLKAITPKANTPESTGIALTAARLVTATVAVEALLTGKATILLYAIPGA